MASFTLPEIEIKPCDPGKVDRQVLTCCMSYVCLQVALDISIAPRSFKTPNERTLGDK